jgi:dTDP-4-dehydrorhamnose reductase
LTRFLVTGASGLLGLNLALKLAQEHDVTGVIHQPELEGTPFEVLVTDLSLPGEAEWVLEHCLPEVVIHCAAMAIVDECEKDPSRAMSVNADLPGRMARLAAEMGARFIHISTDAVFDGVKGDYQEEDTPNPLSTYARTKLAGEIAVMAENPDALIARVNFFGWSLRGNRSLAEFFYNNLSAGKEVNGFTDVIFCPLLVQDLIDLLFIMNEKLLTGLFHTVGSEKISKYDFGVQLAKKFGFDPALVKPVSVKEGGLAATRSLNLNLDTHKLSAELNRSLPQVTMGLDRFHELWENGYPNTLRGFLAGE